MKIRIPLARPEITDADRNAVLQVLRTPHLSMGPKLREFEQAMCDYTGAKFAVAVNSGTSALHLAIRALQIERGAEVILPSFTFSALLNVILETGLRPRFVDIDQSTFNSTPEMIEAAITAKTQLILAVHTFGFPADTASLREIAKRKSRGRGRSIHMIEDACEALGAEVRGSKAGTFGEAGLFAFYPNKQITTGEGGMLITSNKKLAEAAARLRNQGRNPKRGWNQHVEAGFSYRVADINCALGISQLARIDAVVAHRQALAETYDHALACISEITRPPLTSPVGRISWFVYPIYLAAQFTRKHRNRVCEAMLMRGIATGKYFSPLHRQPVWRNRVSVRRKYQLPITESVADRVIALPFFNELTETEVHEVADALDDSIRELRRKI